MYSHSKLQTFEQCPLKYKFRYIDKLIPVVGRFIEGFLGKRVHEALEWLYKQVNMGKVPELQEVIKVYEEAWKENFDEKDIFFVRDFTEEDYFEKGKKFIESYYKKNYPFEENTIAIEKKIVFFLDKEEKYQLQGYIDRLVFNEKEKKYEIHDYKTANNLKTEKELNADKQLALYSLAIKQMFPDVDKVCLIWHFLAFDKTFCVEKSDEELEKLKQETIELIKIIERTKPENLKPKISVLCDWCEFKPICPKWKHYENNKDKPLSDYMKEDGVRLVNEYAELLRKRQDFNLEIEEEIEKVKTALVNYAEENNLDTVYGKDQKARVWIKDTVKFPGKNDPGREALRKLLEIFGKYKQFSMIDAFALARAVDNQDLPEELLEQLQALQTKERIERIYLSKSDREK